MKSLLRINQTGSRLRVTLFCLLIGLALMSTQDFAQVKTGQPESYPLEVLPQAGEQPLEGPLQPLLREEQPTEGQPLEGAIDPQTYLLGPGDLIGISIMGDVDQEFLARVSVDGTLRISTLGIIQAAGKTFAAAKAEILEEARRSYHSEEIAVYLVQLRSFKASIGGMVWVPGTYTLTATDRAVALLARAGGFYNPVHGEETPEPANAPVNLEREKKEEVIPELPGYSARRAQLIHLDGSSEPVDLLMFLRAGRPEGNPYLRDGDFLLVPPLNPKSGVLGIYGAVNRQGLLEYVPGDNLERALLLAGGLTDAAQRDSIEIARFSRSGREFHIFYVDLDDPAAQAMSLQPDDRIYVREQAQYHPRCQVELRGEVMKPGWYPVAETGTPLVDVVQLAGGFTPKASLYEATLTRKFGQELLDPEYERLRTMPPVQMNALEYQYFKNKSQEIKGRVVVDFYALFVKGDSTQNILLRDQDILEIPPLTHTVKVTGQVNQPGIVSFVPGRDCNYYIKESGGFAWHAARSRVRIIKAVTGKWLKPGHAQIEEGDTIFIPAKPERDNWLLLKDVMLLVSQVATIYLIVVTRR